MSIEVTKAELTKAKRAVLVLKELADVAVKVADQPFPLEVKLDLQVLLRLLKKLDAVAK